MKKVIIVLAGNNKQAREYIRDNKDMIYCDHPGRCRGLIAERVGVIGTFWERDDAAKLLEEANYRVR